jgi:hypothetical protein
MTVLRGITIAAALYCGVAWAQVLNGDFEAEGVATWQSFGADVSVRRIEPPGWARFGSEFSSRGYRQLRLYLRIQMGTGVVWFDEAGVDGLALENPGFEAAEGDDIVAWEQDNIGDTIFADDEAPVAGARCVRLEQRKPGVSRIWQDTSCEPGTAYRASVWMRTAGFRGDAYAEVYGLANGELGEIIWQSRHLSGATDQRLGRKVLELRATNDGRGGVEQEIDLPPGQNLLLSADLSVPRLSEGALTVGLQSGGEALAEVQVDSPTDSWERRQLVLQSPPDGKATVRVQVHGSGSLAYVDNVSIGQPTEGLSALKAQFVGADRNLPLDGVLHVRLPERVDALLPKGVAVLAKAVAAATEGEVEVTVGDEQPLVDVAVRRPGGGGPLRWPVTESYVLTCSESGVRLVSPTEQGAFYGMMAIPELLDRTPGGKWQLIAAKLEDAPQLPFRATYMAGLPTHRAERLVWCERLAGLRLNAVVFEDDIWWDLDNEESRRAAQEAFEDFRSYGLEPIPELQSFGWAHIVLARDPMVAEGTWVQRERLVLKGEEPVALAHANVLRTEATDIKIERPPDIEYEEERDYEVIDGETRHVYRPDAEPYRIRRLPGSRIPDGGTVYASYDYVSRVNSQNCPYCPSEPRTAEIMVAAIRNTVKYLSPKYVHIGHDEPAQMNTDSRCRNRLVNGRRMTNAELFAEDVGRLRTAATDIDANVRLMMWADAVNPYHNGLQFPDDPTANALPLLPRDIILNVWFYGADQPLQQGADSLRYFGGHGFATTGSPWDDPLCARRWARACLDSRLRGEECMGILYTSWGGRWEALEACAKSAWRPPAVAGAATEVAER